MNIGLTLTADPNLERTRVWCSCSVLSNGNCLATSRHPPMLVLLLSNVFYEMNFSNKFRYYEARSTWYVVCTVYKFLHLKTFVTKHQCCLFSVHCRLLCVVKELVKNLTKFVFTVFLSTLLGAKTCSFG